MSGYGDEDVIFAKNPLTPSSPILAEFVGSPPPPAYTDAPPAVVDLTEIPKKNAHLPDERTRLTK
jgi:hypothetical protein